MGLRISPHNRCIQHQLVCKSYLSVASTVGLGFSILWPYHVVFIFLFSDQVQCKKSGIYPSGQHHPLSPVLPTIDLWQANLHQFLTHPTPRTHLVSIPDEDKRHNPQRQADQAQQRTTPSHARAREHRPRDQRQHGRAGTTAAAHGRHRTGREGLVRVGQVVQQRHEEQVEAHAETQACRHGHRPVDLWAGRPTQPEEGGDAQRPADAGERQAAVFFDGDPGRLARLCAAEEEVVSEEDAAAEKDAEGDCGRVSSTEWSPVRGEAAYLGGMLGRRCQASCRKWSRK